MIRFINKYIHPLPHEEDRSLRFFVSKTSNAVLTIWISLLSVSRTTHNITHNRITHPWAVQINFAAHYASL